MKSDYNFKKHYVAPELWCIFVGAEIRYTLKNFQNDFIGYIQV